MQLVSFLILFSYFSTGFADDERSWVLMNPSRTLPSNCHVGGYENSKHYQGPVYIGRAQIDEELAIGKVIDSWKSGYFPKNGNEHWKNRYEVLCGGKVYWIPVRENHENLIAGGKAGNGEPFYVCRGIYNEQLTPGKYYKPTGCCYIVSDGKEHCVKDFSILRY